MSGWRRRQRRGSAAELHEWVPPRRPVPTVDEVRVDAPVVVLGSTQPEADLDASRVAAAGLGIARRRSGGGAVLLVPGAHVWVDVWVPAGSPRWSDDVTAASAWLGAWWVDALVAAGVAARGRFSVHDGAMVTTPWSRRVCFAGLAAGEVVLDGRKLVGVSQRRTRDWIRLQCMVHRRWDADALFGLLSDPTAGAAAAAHRRAVAAVGDAGVVAALHRTLPHD